MARVEGVKWDGSDRYDQYTLVRPLVTKAKAMQGRSFVVEDKAGETKVMKMMECNDDHEVALVFDEAIPLLTLKHQYISGIDDLFIHYDTGDESVFVVVVSKFFETGELAFVLNQYRSKESALPESIVKKWLGQLVEALLYMHVEKGIPHRAIKPSNIYLTPDMNVCLGDFGIDMVMQDLVTRPRTAAVCNSWLPPDDKVFGFLPDIWALGGVLLDVGTSAYTDETMCTEMRTMLRSTPEALEQHLGRVLKSYSKDYCGMLRMFLTPDTRSRPNMEDIVQIKYTRECLKLCKSTMIATDAKRVAMATAVKPSTTKRIPDVPREIFQYIETQIKRVGVVVVGLENLTRIAMSTKGQTNPIKLDHTDRQTIHNAMNEYIENRFVQIAVIDFLRSLTPTAAAEELAPFVAPALEALETHNLSIEFITTCCHLLASMSGHPELVALIAEAGGVKILMEVWHLNPDNPAAVGGVINAVCGQMTVDASVAEVIALGGHRDAIAALAQFGELPDVLGGLCSVVWALAMDDVVLELFVEKKLVLDLLKLAEAYPQDTELLVQLSLALTTLFVDHRCAVQANGAADVSNPIQPMIACLGTHRARSDVVGPIVGMLNEMCRHFVLVELLLPCDVVEILTRLKQEHRYRPQLANLCHETLRTITTASA